MPGLIRFLSGLIMAMTAVDSDMAPLTWTIPLAALGLALMWWSTAKIVDKDRTSRYN